MTNMSDTGNTVLSTLARWARRALSVLALTIYFLVVGWLSFFRP
jgi:hypothetical protein